MPRRSLRPGVLVLAMLLAAGYAASSRRGEPLGRPIVLTTPSEARGQVVYMKHCYHCHQGGEGGLAPALLQLAPGPILRTQIRLGLGVMPAFSFDEITPAEMDDLIAYIKALRRS